MKGRRLKAKFVSGKNASDNMTTSAGNVINRILTWVVLFVALGTALIVRFGPGTFWAPHKLLLAPYQGFSELRDTAAYLSWLAISFFAFIAYLSSQRLNLRVSERAEGAVKHRVYNFLSVVAVIVLFSNLFGGWETRSLGNVAPISVLDLIKATLFWLPLYLIWYNSKKYYGLKNYFIVVFSVFLLIRFFVIFARLFGGSQTDYPFAINEMTAPAVGKIPWIDFIPQYSALLGFLIVPLLQIFSSHATSIVFAWIATLEMVCIVVPIIVAFKIGGKKTLAVSMFFVVSLMAMSPNMLKTVQILPLRLIFPALIFAFIGLTEISSDWRKRIAQSSILGALTGLMLLNNLDFGLPTAISLCLASLSMFSSLRNWINYCSVLVLSASTVFGLYFAFAYLFFEGHVSDIANMLIYPKVYGVAGFYREPMVMAGMHVNYVIYFIFGLCVSVFLFHRSRILESQSIKKISSLLIFSSVWGLLSMVYFSSRSLPSSLMSGLNYQLAITAILISVYFTIDRDYLIGQTNIRFRKHLVLIAIPVSFLVFSLVFVVARTPLGFTSPKVWQENANYSENLLTFVELANDSLDGIVDFEGNIYQVAVMSNLVELSTGIKSALNIVHPEVQYIFSDLEKFQCEEIVQLKSFYLVLLNSESISPFSEFVSCKDKIRSKLIYSGRGEFGKGDLFLISAKIP